MAEETDDERRKPYPIDDHRDDRTLELVWYGQWQTQSLIAKNEAAPDHKRRMLFMTGRRMDHLVSQAYSEGFDQGHLNGMEFLRYSIEHGQNDPIVPPGFVLVEERAEPASACESEQGSETR